MIPLVIIRKIFLFFAPLVIFYILRRLGRKDHKRKSHLSEVNKSKIIEGELIKEEK